MVTGRLVRTLAGHTYRVIALASLPAGCCHAVPVVTNAAEYTVAMVHERQAGGDLAAAAGFRCQGAKPWAKLGQFTVSKCDMRD